MFFKNILVPYDESDHARSALHVALGMAGAYPEAKVHVVTVIPAGALPTPSLIGDDALNPSYALGDPYTYDKIVESMLHRARTNAESAIKGAKDDAVCQVVADAVVASSPVEGIAEYVEQHGIDLVVMGRRGLGALRGMLGSVSFGVLRSVSVPVLTVK